MIKRLAEAANQSDATSLDALRALKDRLLGTAAIDSEEMTWLSALLQVDLSAAAGDVDSLDSTLRLACGLWLTTPDFHLLGDPGVALKSLVAPVPPLISGNDFATTCAHVFMEMGVDDGLCNEFAAE